MNQPTGTSDPPARSPMWRCLQVIARILVAIMFDLKVWGRQNVPRRGGVLLAANHQSNLDPVLVAVMLSRPVSSMGKSELFMPGAFGWLLRALHSFPVRQGEGDIGALREAIRRLKEENVLAIFPEGSRTWDGEIAELEKGISLVVRRAGVPVVPVAIEGSFQAFRRGTMLPRRHDVRMIYGPPMNLAQLPPEQILAEIDGVLRSMQAELRRRRRDELAGEPAMEYWHV